MLGSTDEVVIGFGKNGMHADRELKCAALIESHGRSEPPLPVLHCRCQSQQAARLQCWCAQNPQQFGLRICEHLLQRGGVYADAVTELMFLQARGGVGNMVSTGQLPDVKLCA